MKKVALITGANRGLGLETARQLAEAGATVIIGARDSAKGEDAAGQLRREGLDVESVTIDVDDASSVEASADWVRARHGHLDILVNNAGIAPEASAGDTAGEVLDVEMSKLLTDTSIKVNSVCPGFARTDITPVNREQAPLGADEAARFVVEMALIGDDGPTGRFADRDGAVAW